MLLCSYRRKEDKNIGSVAINANLKATENNNKLVGVIIRAFTASKNA